MNRESRIMGIKNIIKSISRGFTLIELMIAIAIVGVLASAAVVALNPLEQFAKSRDAQRKNDLHQIRNALELYYNDSNRYPPASGPSGDLIDGVSWGSQWGSYMSIVPKDPSSPTQEYKYETDGTGTYFRLYAKLERCSDGQIIPGTCEDSHNYSITSTNVATAPLPTSTPTSTPTPTPTAVPAPRVFVTSTKYNGNMGGLSGADGKCQERANILNLGGTWKAWLSDGSNWPANGARFTQSSTPYRLLNGTKAADDWADLIDGTLDAPINIDEFKSSVLADTLIHTGTGPQGTSAPNHCNGWTSNTSSYGSTIGHAGRIDSPWSWLTSSSSDYCNNTYSLYCFEQ